MNKLILSTKVSIQLNYCRLFLAFCLILVSCKKLLTVNNVNQLTTPKVFFDDNTADAAMASVYSNWTANVYLFQIQELIGNMASDELLSTNSISDDLPYMNDAILPSDQNIAGIWQAFYNTIYQANEILEGIATSNSLSAEKKQQLLGEAHFMRAFCYFYLVNLWDNVPLVTTTDVSQSAMLARAPAATIYAEIIADLQSAQDNLSTSYPTAERVRANKFVATALLARVYLFDGKYDSAVDESTMVINSGEYRLEGDLTKVFLANSNEAILQGWEQYGYLPSTRKYVPYGVTPSYYLHPSLVQAFESGDLRMKYWTQPILYDGETDYLSYKYHTKTITTGEDAEYLMLLRFAEQYLIRSEAYLKTGNIKAALDDLNQIRSRAGLTALPNSLSANQCEDALMQERRVEYANECFDRWLTLKRTKQVDSVMAALKPTWKSNAQLWPIPQVEIANNNLITQNPGY